MYPPEGDHKGRPYESTARWRPCDHGRGRRGSLPQAAVYQEQSTVDSRQLTIEDEARNQHSTRHSSLATRQFWRASFLLDAHNRVHFALGPYDHTRPLVIDPVLSYSTYLGGSITDSRQWHRRGLLRQRLRDGLDHFDQLPHRQPVPGEFGRRLYDAFVTKLNPPARRWSTPPTWAAVVIDSGYGIAVDSAGNAYVTGQTCSTNFPTRRPSRQVAGGVYDAFVTKLNPAGSALVYSTYLGGSERRRQATVSPWTPPATPM